MGEWHHPLQRPSLPLRCRLPTTHVHPHPPIHPSIPINVTPATSSAVSSSAIWQQVVRQSIRRRSIDGHAIFLQPPGRHWRRDHPPPPSPAAGPRRSRGHLPRPLLRRRSHRRRGHGGGAGCRRAAGQGVRIANFPNPPCLCCCWLIDAGYGFSRMKLPTWAEFELGRAPVYWKTSNGLPPSPVSRRRPWISARFPITGDRFFFCWH